METGNPSFVNLITLWQHKKTTLPVSHIPLSHPTTSPFLTLSLTRFFLLPGAFFGFWFVWHSLSLAAWWLNLVINLFVGLVFETTIPLWGFCVMFVVAWFGTAIFPIVGISIGHIQSSGTAICFLDIDYTSWLFVIPHTFIFGCALLLLIPIVWKVSSRLFLLLFSFSFSNYLLLTSHLSRSLSFLDDQDCSLGSLKCLKEYQSDSIASTPSYSHFRSLLFSCHVYSHSSVLVDSFQ
jgi:hypothetical protein